MKKLSNFIVKLASYVFVAYFLVSFSIFAPFYNYEYAKQNGFIKWLLLGQIVPTIKALAFPYFEYQRYYNKQISKELDKIFGSLTYYKEAISLLINQQNIEQSLFKLKQAYNMINQVNFELAKKSNYDFVIDVEKYYKPALKKYVEGYESGNTYLITEGDILFNKFREKLLKYSKQGKLVIKLN
ncbi:hypothetical protein FHQ18_00410 [Deferribacter autotrophicus]|uniref:Uncharacterized protein n=1 Tax=Deferribacter autotrophicus TaxID=500465 RepID=A0A5A8F724_9BACT|nr:hypothetical protein [Deferribacter autotrophicus]KAA0259373.1 hypothetical protein FHQ18_00410 [Deferribacter autotrophicus]